MQNILSGFLTAGLLPIGDDDEKLKLLEAAASDLAEQIKAKPLLAHRFTLVGLDDRVPASDPVHVVTEKAILEKWQTIANKIGTNAVQVHRGVILRALQIAATDNENLRLAVLLAAANRPRVSGKEQSAVAAMLTEFEAITAEDFDEIWMSQVDLALPRLSGKVKRAQLNKEELSAGLARATGPTDRDGKAQTNPNPHWPNAGAGWSHEFAGRAAEAIASAFQGAAKGYLDEIQEAVREGVQVLADGIDRMAVRDAKSELLWIRTSLYSPSARRSYRDLNTDELLLHAVIDASRAVNHFAPPSVAFFLRELVSELDKKKVPLAETLASVGPKIAALQEAEPLLNHPLGAKGRRGLVDYAVRPSASESFEQQTGLKDNLQETLPELAVRLYTELQILKLLTSTS